MKIIGKAQPSLVLAHLDVHSGGFAFVCCRKVLQELTGQKIKSGDIFRLGIKFESFELIETRKKIT